MERNDRLSEVVQHGLAEIVNRHLKADGFMVTISGIELSPNGSRVRVYVSVLPDKFYGSALESLRRLSPVLRGELVRKCRLRAAPKIDWRIDPTEKKAAELEKYFKLIEEDL